MKDRKKRNLIIGVLCCLLVFMGVGFAALNTTLKINGTASAINNWDVRMTNIEVVEKSEGTTNQNETTISEDGVTANFKTDFTKPGDYIKYAITVENNGTIDAVLNDVSIILNVSESDKNLFNVVDNRPENKLLASGTSLTFYVTVEFRKDADRMPSSDIRYTVRINYLQQTGDNLGGEEDWTFRVDESGTIVAYNYEKGTDVVIPAEVDGIPVKKIDSLSFMPYTNALYYVTNKGVSVVIKDESNFDKIKAAFEASNFAVGESNYYTESQFSVLDFVVYGAYGYYVDLITNDAIQVVSNITSLDFSNAINLEEIAAGAFMNDSLLVSVNFGSISSLKSIGVQAFYYTSITGELVLPEGLTNLDLNAFQGNKITTLTIPSTVTYIDEGVFEKNPIEKIIFKRTKDDFESNVYYHTPLCDSYASVEKVYQPIA